MKIECVRWQEAIFRSTINSCRRVAISLSTTESVALIWSLFIMYKDSSRLSPRSIEYTGFYISVRAAAAMYNCIRFAVIA